MLGNSTRGLLPLQKWLLYHLCVVLIATYGFRLWFFAGAPTKAQVLLLAAMQHKAALWILGAFGTSLTGEIEALAGLIPIQLHFKKLVKWFYLRTVTLPSQHALMSLLSARNSRGTRSYPQSLVLLNNAQCTCLKGPLLDTKMSLLSLTKHFNPLDAETTPDYRLLNSFPECISFYPCNCSSLNDHNAHLESLDCLCLETSSFSSTLVVVTDASAIPPRSIQAVSAAHFWRLGYQMLSSKASAGRTTASDAKLFAIRLDVSKATSMDIEHIILITDSLGSARRSVDPNHFSSSNHHHG